VEEQGAATQEISRNVQQAAQGTQQVSSHITDVQRGASETGSASSQVLSAAQSLAGESDRLKNQVEKFLNNHARLDQTLTAKVRSCAGRRHDEPFHALLRPASKKRQGTKSRDVCGGGAAGAMGILPRVRAC
jgi:hypothetical protein